MRARSQILQLKLMEDFNNNENIPKIAKKWWKKLNLSLSEESSDWTWTDDASKQNMTDSFF